MVTTKKCSKCGTIKKLDKFYVNYRCKHGVDEQCIECCRSIYMPRFTQKIHDTKVIDRYMSGKLSIIEMSKELNVPTSWGSEIITERIEQLSGKFNYAKYNKILSVRTIGDWNAMSETEQKLYV